MSEIKRITDESCQAFLSRLSVENRQFYESDRGKGALKDLQQKFPHPWLYVAELIQNAVDEKAKIIRISQNGDKTLIFEHDGRVFDEYKDVIGLCTKGVSYKGAGTVGFMGVGFKAVFRSYQTVKISSGDWRFFLKVGITIGTEYHNQNRNWLGAVLPSWDASIAAPSEGMTCRFELIDRVEGLNSIESDLNAVLKNDKALLPLLSQQGVKELDWNGVKWLLSVDKEVPFEDGTGSRLHVNAKSKLDGETFSWIIFSQEYTPSRDAIRKFLEHRQLIATTIEEEKKINEDASKARRVEAFFEVDKYLFPILPDVGEAYALLPTSVKLPIGINIQADWLLTQSRQEFMDADLKNNPWHREIIENIPKITKQYFQWALTGEIANNWKLNDFFKVYKILPSLDSITINTYGWFLEADSQVRQLKYCELIAKELENLQFIPKLIPDDKIDFISPKNARILPFKLLKCEENRDLRPWQLFGENVASRNILKEKYVYTLREIGLLKELSPDELAVYWGNGIVKDWYENFSNDIRDQRLETLLAILYEMDNDGDWNKVDLKCLPSKEDDFISRNEAVRFPTEWNIVINEQDIALKLEPFIRKQGHIIKWNFDHTITSRQQHLKTKAKDYLETIKQPELIDVVRQWWESLPQEELSAEQIDFIVKFTLWVAEKQPQRKELIQKILCKDNTENLHLSMCNKVLLEEPYARSYRKLFYPAYPSVSNKYYEVSDTVDWHSFFESLDPCPVGRFMPVLNDKKYDNAQLQGLLGNDFPVPQLRKTSDFLKWKKNEIITVDYKTFTIVDYKIPEHVMLMLTDRNHNDGISFYKWIKEKPGALREYVKNTILFMRYNTNYISELSHPIIRSTWIEQLARLKWIFTPEKDGPYSPEEVLIEYDPVRPTAPVADHLPEELVKILEGAGIKFGTAIPKSDAIQKLQIRGKDISPDELVGLIDEIMDEHDIGNVELFRKLLDELPLIPVPKGVNLLDSATRVPFSRVVKRVGQGFRSNLGYLIALQDLRSDSPIVRLFETRKDFYTLPEKTTAFQAINFINWVWGRQPDAEAVRRYLPFAFAYINEDKLDNPGIMEEWQKVLPNAMGYTLGRRWLPIFGANQIYFDDLQAPDLQIISKPQLITPGHLGPSDRIEQQRKAARLLSVTLVSDEYQVEPVEGNKIYTPTSWNNRFSEIQKAVLEILQLIDDYEDSEENIFPADDSKFQYLGIRRFDSLSINIVTVTDQTPKETKEAYALMKGNDVLVSGEPEDFASELSDLLINHYNASRKRNISPLVAQITRLLMLIDSEKFNQHLNKFRKKFGLDTIEENLSDHAGKEMENKETGLSEEKKQEPSEPCDFSSPTSEKSEASHITGSAQSHQSHKEQLPDSQSQLEESRSTGQSGSFVFKGETLSKDEGESGAQAPELMPPTKPGQGKQESGERRKDHHKKLNRLISYVIHEDNIEIEEEDDISDDERPENLEIGQAAQKFAFEYEINRAWKPTMMDHNNPGYDIESINQDGRKIFIEVKGIDGQWTKTGVALSATQFEYALKYEDDYWLYIVENARSRDIAKIHRIENPAKKVTQFRFDQGWKNIAENQVQHDEDTNYGFIGKNVRVPSMSGREGTILNVVVRGKLKLLTIVFEDGQESEIMYDPNKITII
jgi:hypothetical protein